MPCVNTNKKVIEIVSVSTIYAHEKNTRRGIKSDTSQYAYAYEHIANFNDTGK